MGERKVLNKYYPPDFDPAKILRRKQPENHQIKVRTMLPMSIRCNSCGNYMYQGTKFNCRKEDVMGEMYLGFQNLRFYFKCTQCCAEFTIKTDYKNSDYVVERGATRNFEPWRDQDEGLERKKRRRDLGDAMESLENRTLESKREMDKIAAIDELKSLKSRQETVRVEELLESIRRRDQEKEKKPMAEEDEAIIRSLFHGTKDNVVRIDDDGDDDDDDGKIADRDEASNRSAKRSKVSEEPADRKSIFPSLIGRVVAKRKPVHLAEDEEPEVNADGKDDQRHGRSTISVLQSLCNYHSEEDE